MTEQSPEELKSPEEHPKHVLPFPHHPDPHQQRLNRQAWVEALRSGDFKQGRSTLVRRSKTGTLQHCCLGVACAMHPDLKLMDHFNSDGLSFDDGGSLSYYSVLPPVVQAALGLRTSDGLVSVDWTLTRMNDGGSSFDRIADVIEAELMGLLAAEAY